MSRGRILVTGGAGYIGSHACKTLARAGYVPITYDNLSNGHRWAVRWGPLVEGDLADSEKLRRVLAQERIDAVMHFAAFAYVGESMVKPREYFHNNVVNTLNLLAAMQDAGVARIVVSSTCSVYGEAQALPIPETQPCLPINPYGESKLFVERALAWHEQAYGLRWMALRYFNAAGADPEGELGEIHEPETHVLPLVIQTALGLRPQFDIFGTDYPSPDGSCVRDFVHVSDVADAHVRALDHLIAGRSSCSVSCKILTCLTCLNWIYSL